MYVNCGAWRRQAIEAARGAETTGEWREHLRVCAECARFFDDQAALSAAMRAMAEGAPELSGAVEARVLAEFERAHVPAWRWAVAAMIAAGIFVGAWWSLQSRPAPTAKVETRPFLTIPYTVPLSPEEPVMVWRAEIPVAQLIAAGFRVNVPDPAAVVEADVLVGQDGRARAIRPISISTMN